ncbi:hypothetical protein ADUPG1_005997 [Aduncisulcus paluster]|uniref:Uncharacterized protein n=1 Tax=Aduncisulcus paluster TaxID=2918883 RepID=A0ABQ5KL04_9EUKA|nr:hypothetical protein ADUPG1_005997 [Aduncisulcus paluster]
MEANKGRIPLHLKQGLHQYEPEIKGIVREAEESGERGNGFIEVGIHEEEVQDLTLRFISNYGPGWLGIGGRFSSISCRNAEGQKKRISDMLERQLQYAKNMDLTRGSKKDLLIKKKKQIRKKHMIEKKKRDITPETDEEIKKKVVLLEQLEKAINREAKGKKKRSKRGKKKSSKGMGH